jgi:hypothetical protein
MEIGTVQEEFAQLRLSLLLIALVAASALCAAPTQARITLAYCETSPRGPYLLVRKTTCREGRSVLHKIGQRKSEIDRLPFAMHVAGWSCRIGKFVNNAAEHPIWCHRGSRGLIWAGIQL